MATRGMPQPMQWPSGRPTPWPNDPRPHGPRQRGAAVIMALLVVTLATLMLSIMVTRQHARIRSVETHSALAQSRWIERAAVDWARAILREDPREIDSLQEPWATPVADTRLDASLSGAAADDVRGEEAALLAGQVTDQQGRYNLQNLVDASRRDAELAVLRKLFALLAISPQLADAVVQYQLAALADPSGPRQFRKIGDLEAVPGLDRQTLDRLLPFLTLLPEATPLNINTTQAVVLAARFPELDLSDAQRLILSRDQAPFRSVAEINNRMPRPLTLDPAQVSVASRYFSVVGYVRFRRAEVRSETLLRREGGSGGAVTVVWQRNA